MAYFSATISLLLLVLSVSSPSVHGSLQVVECTALMVHMVGCSSFVRIGSTVNVPAGMCCNGLKTVLNMKAECLCEVLKNGGFMGIKLDVVRLSTLPVACKLTVPPAMSACGPSTVDPPPPATSPAANAAPEH